MGQTEDYLYYPTIADEMAEAFRIIGQAAKEASASITKVADTMTPKEEYLDDLLSMVEEYKED